MRIASVAFQGLFVGVTIVLFSVWLAESPSRRPALWPDCVALGKGGVRCAAPSAREARSNASFGAGEDCVSLGRGGLFCKTPTGNRGPAG